MKNKKISIIILIIGAILLNSSLINRPQIILYIQGEQNQVVGVQYKKILKNVDMIFEGEMGRTKSEFDKEEELRCKSYKCIEIIYPYPKLRVVKMEGVTFNLGVDLSSKILIPLDKNDSSYELFTCNDEYTSGGLGFDTIYFENAN